MIPQVNEKRVPRTLPPPFFKFYAAWLIDEFLGHTGYWSLLKLNSTNETLPKLPYLFPREVLKQLDAFFFFFSSLL